jgi:hypothetical protein
MSRLIWEQNQNSAATESAGYKIPKCVLNSPWLTGYIFKHSGSICTTSFDTLKHPLLPIDFICFMRSSQYTAIILSSNINGLVSVAEMKCFLWRTIIFIYCNGSKPKSSMQQKQPLLGKGSVNVTWHLASAAKEVMQQQIELWEPIAQKYNWATLLLWDIIWIWSYVTTDSQSVSLPWCQAPIRDPRPIFLSPWNFL